MSVISASRRTDIPAYHSDWLINKIDRGFCLVVNPFNGVVSNISLRPDDVDCFVFWTRNFAPLLKHESHLDDLGLGFYVQYTLNGYPSPLESYSPSVDSACNTMLDISKRRGPRALVWRYDPIILTSITDRAWHTQNFERLCKRLEGATDTCVISFIDHYRKLDWNFYPALKEAGVEMYGPSMGELKSMMFEFADIANEHGFALQTCCEPEFWNNRIEASSCIDPKRLTDVTGKDYSGLISGSTRKGCRCFESRDIGAYNTCSTGCAYCYANSSQKNSAARLSGLRPEDLSLTPLPKSYNPANEFAPGSPIR